MTDRVLLLALPSAIVLSALLLHSFITLERRRAVAFWTSVLAYGAARGLAVRLVTERGLHASSPYVFHDQGPALFGVSLQELAGWALVAYLGWWFGCRLARSTTERRRPALFVQVAWACVFLAAASWAVETAAAAAGWWHWTIPASFNFLGPVPGIGLLDWSFVGIDFLLPFLAWSAPALRGSRWRWLTLTAFPLHFAGHLAPLDGIGWAIYAVAHGGLLLAVLALALFARTADDAFENESSVASWIPTAAIGVMVTVLAVAFVGFGRRPDLLVSFATLATFAPFATLGATMLRTRRAWLHALVAGGFVGLAWIEPRFVFAAGLSMIAVMLGWARRGGRPRATAVLAAFAIVILTTPLTVARNETRLKEGLDQAIAARDRGDLTGAERSLAQLVRTGPRSHVPLALLGEIRYRIHDVQGAAEAFAEAVSIQPAFVEGYRHLAVLDIRSRRLPSALEHARRGLVVKPDDLELAYLEQRANGAVSPSYWKRVIAQGPDAASTIASLAFEVGDAPGAAAVLDLAVARWPGDSSLDQKRARVSLAAALP